jgi:anaerobic magnesium-protoporphyrin IX monomethyl ester cyclase
MPGILLIQPPIRDYYLTKKRTIPYGLMGIAACLEQKGFAVALLDALATPKSKMVEAPSEMAYLKPFYGRKDRSPLALFHLYRHFGYAFEHIAKMVGECNPRMVGIVSLFTPYADMAAQTAKLVKKILPDCPVVMGGHHPTELPREALQCRAVDFLIRGEGEKSMVLLAEALQNGRDPRDVPGICFRNSDGSLTISEPAVIKSLDKLPRPAAHLIKANYYQRGNRGAYTILASRGCPFSCSYCAMGRSAIGGYRTRSVDSIIAEMDHAVQTLNCGFFDFEDENLSHDKAWFANLLEAIIRNFKGHPLELRAMNSLFPPSLNQHLLGLMKNAGFNTLNLSLGTTSASQLHRFNRPDVRSAFNDSIDFAGQLNLACVGYIIVGAPFQDPMQSVEDLLYVWRKGVLAGVSVFYPAPGSADYAQCERWDLLPHKISLYRSSALPLDHTTSRLQTVTLLRLGRIVNFMKMLSDQGIPIPDAESCSQAHIPSSTNRIDMGRLLLQWFLKDGNIRGVDGKGQIYVHAADLELVQRFIARLRS